MPDMLGKNLEEHIGVAMAIKKHAERRFIKFEKDMEVMIERGL